MKPLPKWRLDILKDWLTWPYSERSDTCPFNRASCYSFCKKHFDLPRSSVKRTSIDGTELLDVKAYTKKYGSCDDKVWRRYHLYYDCPCDALGSGVVTEKIKELIKENN